MKDFCPDPPRKVVGAGAYLVITNETMRRFYIPNSLILCAILLSCFLHNACYTDEVLNFQRVRQDKKKLQNHRGAESLPDFYGNIYISKQDITFPVFNITAPFTLKSRFTGDIGIYFNVFSKSAGDNLEIRKGTPDTSAPSILVLNIPLKRGVNEISFFHQLKDSEYFRLTSSQGAGLIFSTPIIYKIIPRNKRRLIFLISVDTLSALHLRSHGYDKRITPHLDAFAEDSVIFKNAFANSSWTLSSHMSLFTSLLEHEHKAKVAKKYIKKENQYVIERRYVFPLPSSVLSLIENLAKKFITISYNGGGNVSANIGFYRGFDLYQSNRLEIEDPWASRKLFEKTGKSLLDFSFPQAFYFLHTYQVHMPYNPPKLFLDQLVKEPKIKEFDFYKDLGGFTNIFRVFSPAIADEVKSLYDAEILVFDEAFNDFLKFLKANDLYNKAMIILFSDHGESFFEHGSWAHANNLYNEQIKIPLIIKFPGQAFKGREIETNVSLSDVMPTILEYFDISYPKNKNGESLLGIIEGNTNTKERIVVSSIFRSKAFSFLPGKIAVIYKNFKLIYNEPYNQRTLSYFAYPPPSVADYELYDLNKDKSEKNNLFLKDSKPREIQHLLNYMNELIKQMRKNKIKVAESQRKKMPAELIEQLKTLGYVE